MVVGALGKRVSRQRDYGFEPRPLRTTTYSALYARLTSFKK